MKTAHLKISGWFINKNQLKKIQERSILFFIFNIEIKVSEILKTENPLDGRLPQEMKCGGLTVGENGGAAVVAPKSVRSPRQNPTTGSFFQPRGRLPPHSRLQQVLQVLH